MCLPGGVSQRVCVISSLLASTTSQREKEKRPGDKYWLKDFIRLAVDRSTYKKACNCCSHIVFGALRVELLCVCQLD